jgi:RNA polymerase sigma-70 factor (ECF subfamily)
MEIAATAVEGYRAELVAYACRMLGDAHEAEDCVQNAMLSALRNSVRPQNLRAWLYRVVHNLAVSHLRRGGPRHAPESRIDAGTGAVLDDADELEASIAGLPQEYRAILLLRFTHGLAFEEIADIVGRPVGTTKVYAGRALSLLRRKLRRQS